MPRSVPARSVLLVLVALLAFAVAGCGQKGDLYLPGGKPQKIERKPT